MILSEDLEDILRDHMYSDIEVCDLNKYGPVHSPYFVDTEFLSQNKIIIKGDIQEFTIAALRYKRLQNKGWRNVYVLQQLLNPKSRHTKIHIALDVEELLDILEKNRENLYTEAPFIKG